MRRSFFRTSVASLLILGSSLVMGSCGGDQQQQKQEAVLESIIITSQPTKTAYFEGDVFDATGMVVKAKYSDGVENYVRPKYSLEPLALTDTKVTISYTEKEVTKTADIAITVSADYETGIRTSNRSNQQRIKTTYTEGQSFDPTNMVVSVTMASGKSTALTAEQYTYSPNGPLTTADTKVTVSYKTFTAEINITVNAAS